MENPGRPRSRSPDFSIFSGSGSTIFPHWKDSISPITTPVVASGPLLVHFISDSAHHNFISSKKPFLLIILPDAFEVDHEPFSLSPQSPTTVGLLSPSLYYPEAPSHTFFYHAFRHVSSRMILKASHSGRFIIPRKRRVHGMTFRLPHQLMTHLGHVRNYGSDSASHHGDARAPVSADYRTQ